MTDIQYKDTHGDGIWHDLVLDKEYCIDNTFVVFREKPIELPTFDADASIEALTALIDDLTVKLKEISFSDDQYGAVYSARADLQKQRSELIREKGKNE